MFLILKFGDFFAARVLVMTKELQSLIREISS